MKRIVPAALSLTVLAACGPRNNSSTDVAVIIKNHCVACHSAHPTHAGFITAPVGVTFDTPAEVKKHAVRIKALAVTTTVMPLGNETQMTKAERKTLGDWIDAGVTSN